jgi:hypothetical protein
MGFHRDTFLVSKQAPFLICSQCQPATRHFLSKYQSLERLIQADRLSHPFMTSRFEFRFLYTQFPQANQRPRHRARLSNNASLISPSLTPSLAQTLNGVNPRVGFVHQAVNQPPFQNPVTPHFQSHFILQSFNNEYISILAGALFSFSSASLRSFLIYTIILSFNSHYKHTNTYNTVFKS